jgi:DNA-directed RNA polymerase specialized sigma24 family protein
LTALERGVLALLYEGYKQREVALRLGVPRGEVERAVKAIRSKMGDWRPSGAETPRSVAA